MGGWEIAALVAGVCFGVVALGAIAGSAAAVWTLHHSAIGERKRFEAELAPVREAVGELGDRFDHFYKREAKRDRDAGVVRSGSGASVNTPVDQTRRDRLREIRSRFKAGS